ncbi:hypothetical protein IT407_05145 [Candidatus Uhrbacteria bacterium]|nr:hypothetical protein [Candidatus Uhrbacteria bacterium]
MPNERSTEVKFESEILDEESGLMCRVSIEAWERDVGMICLEYISRGGVAGYVRFGLVNREGLLELLNAVKDPVAGVVSAPLTIDAHILDGDTVKEAEIELEIPLGGRFGHRDFFLKFLPIVLQAMDTLPALSRPKDEPIQTMATPPAAKN